MNNIVFKLIFGSFLCVNALTTHAQIASAQLTNLGAGVNGLDSGVSAYPPTNGYNFGGSNITFTIRDGATIGATNNVSIENNLGSATVFSKDVLIFAGSANITGNIAPHSQISEIQIQGKNASVTFGALSKVGILHFHNNATAIFPDNATFNGKIDILAGTSQMGILQLQGGGSISGSIGETLPLNLLTINALGSAGKTVTLSGATINTPITITDGGNATTLALNNQSMTLFYPITAQTNNINILDVQKASSILSIGSTQSHFSLVKVCANADTYVAGNIFASQVQFQGNHNLIFGGNTISGAITTTAPNQGILTINNNFTFSNSVGDAVNNLRTINIMSPVGSSVSFNNQHIYASVNVNNMGTLAISGQQNIDGGLTLTNNSTLSLAPNAQLNITNTTAPGTLSLDAETVLQLDLSAGTSAIGTITTASITTLNSAATVNIINLPANIPLGTTTIPLITSNGGGSGLYPIAVNGSTATTTFTTQVNNNILDLVITSIALVPSLPIPSVLNAQRNVLRATEQRLHQQYFGFAGGDSLSNVGIWTKIFGQQANQQERLGIPGYKDNTLGFTIGTDALVSESTFAGVAASWAQTRVRYNQQPNARTNIDSYQAMLYGQTLFDNPAFLNGLVAIAYNYYNAQTPYQGWQGGVKTELGYDFAQQSLHIIPLASLYYSYLHVMGGDFNQLLGGLGCEFSTSSVLQPEAHFNLFYAFVNDAMSNTAQFTDSGANFSTHGLKPEQTSFNFGMSLTYFSITPLQFSISYDLDIQKDYFANAAFIKVRYEI